MPELPDAQRDSQVIYYASVFLLAYLGFLIAQPFLVPMGWALVLAITLHPLQARFGKRFGPNRTALALTALVLILLVIPAVLISMALIREGGPALAWLDAELKHQGTAARWLGTVWDWLRERVPFLPAQDVIIARISASVGGFANFFIGQAQGMVTGAAIFLFDLVIVLGVLYILLKDAANFRAILRRVLPFGQERNEHLLGLTRDLVSSSVTAILFIAIVQGVLGGIAFAVLGIPGAPLWGIMIALFALLPAIGAAFIWLPAAVWLAVSGAVVKGIILALVGVFVLSNVDNVIRPVLLSGRARVGWPVLLLSLLGGVSAFGFIGIVLGPLVVAVITALVESYTSDSTIAPTVESDAPPGGDASPPKVGAPTPEAAPSSRGGSV